MACNEQQHAQGVGIAAPAIPILNGLRQIFAPMLNKHLAERLSD
jgi:hypothetical protein